MDSLVLIRQRRSHREFELVNAECEVVASLVVSNQRLVISALGVDKIEQALCAFAIGHLFDVADFGGVAQNLSVEEA